jgi:hypothetical protein
MPTLRELAKQEFVKDVVAMSIFGLVAAALFLVIQNYYSSSERSQMEREASFTLEIEFMTGGANRIKDSFAIYVAEVSEVVTHGMPPDRETRKNMLAASSIIKTELAIMESYDLNLKVRGDVFHKNLTLLNEDIRTYSRGEITRYKTHLVLVQDAYQEYILKLNTVARKHLRYNHRDTRQTTI